MDFRLTCLFAFDVELNVVEWFRPGRHVTYIFTFDVGLKKKQRKMKVNFTVKKRISTNA